MLVRPDLHALSLRPAISRRLAELGAVLQMDNFYWKHPTLEILTKGTHMASRVTVV